MIDIDDASALRANLALQLLDVFPALKKTFASGIPAELREELAHVTTHQLEALGLLLQLRGQAGGATMQQVARMQGCALSTATALADRLIKQGLAERTPDADDRRVVKIAPTARAGDLLERFIESRKQIAIAALRPLDDDEATQLIALLRKVASGGDQDCVPWREVPATGEEVAHG